MIDTNINASITERIENFEALDSFRLEQGLHDLDRNPKNAVVKPSLEDLCKSLMESFAVSNTEFQGCELCGSERVVAGCLDGWHYLESGAARCGLMAGKLEHQRMTALMAAIGLDETKFAKGWNELTVEHQSWRMARGFGVNILEVRQQGLNGFFWGARGRGKTHAALLVCRDAMRAGLSTMRVSWAEFLIHLQASFGKGSDTTGESIYRILTVPDVVLIDEITEDMSDFAQKTMRIIMERRDNGKKSTFFTSNLARKDVEKVLDSRASARFFARIQEVFFNGKDFRADEQDDVADLKKKILLQANV